MTVTLTPPSLGQVEIQVKARGKNVEIEMKSESDQARMTIEGGMEELKASLQSQDLNLSRMEVQVTREIDPSFMDSQFGSFANQQGTQEQGSRASWREDSTANRNSNRSASQRMAQVASVSTPQTAARAVRSGSSRLDIQI